METRGVRRPSFVKDEEPAASVESYLNKVSPGGSWVKRRCGARVRNAVIDDAIPGFEGRGNPVRWNIY